MKINQLIDHTLLKADATEAAILKLCEEAKEYAFKSVCVNSSWVETCAKALKGTEVNICTVIGFPLGAMSTQAKVFETVQAHKDGATEFDMVINIGLLKDKQDDVVRNEIKAIVDAAEGKIVKVIIEACLLTEEEKVRACILSKEAGAHFVKTSTGFSTSGATPEDVRLMKDTVGDACEVKAAGGVRSYDDVLAMVEAGATRIGTSGGVKLIQGDRVKGSY